MLGVNKGWCDKGVCDLQSFDSKLDLRDLRTFKWHGIELKVLRDSIWPN
jgi:hypothetical protein